MLSRINGVLWADEGGNEDATLWTRASVSNGSGGSGATGDSEDEHGFHSFKSMLDDDWFLGFPASGNPVPPSFASRHPFEAFQAHQELKDVAFPLNLSSQEGLLIPSVDSLDQDQSFLTAKSTFSTIFGTVCSNPFDAMLDLGCDASGLLQAPQMSNFDVMPNRGSGGGALGFTGMGGGEQLVCSSLSSRVDTSGGAFASMGSDTFENSSFLNRSKVLRPLEIFPPSGSQPTLFQKRAAAALRLNSTVSGAKGSTLDLQGCGVGQENRGVSMLEEEIEKKRKGNGENEMDEINIDASGLNYDTDDAEAENAKDGSGGSNSNANSTITGSGDRTGKKKGLPAKNLMAERRRRKKLNDRLYMLRSVVPKISKVLVC